MQHWALLSTPPPLPPSTPSPDQEPGRWLRRNTLASQRIRRGFDSEPRGLRCGAVRMCARWHRGASHRCYADLSEVEVQGVPWCLRPRCVTRVTAPPPPDPPAPSHPHQAPGAHPHVSISTHAIAHTGSARASMGPSLKSSSGRKIRRFLSGKTVPTAWPPPDNFTPSVRQRQITWSDDLQSPSLLQPNFTDRSTHLAPPPPQKEVVCVKRQAAETEKSTGGGGGIAVREREIELLKVAGNWRENCGAVTKPPHASKSNTSAQGTHRAPTSTRGGHTKKKHLRKKCRKLREIAEDCGPPTPPPLRRGSCPSPSELSVQAQA